MATKYLDYTGVGTLVGQIKELINKKTAGIASDAALKALQDRIAELEALVESDKDGAINKFNEIVAFLDGIEDTKTLAPIIADVAANKTKLAGIEAGAQKNTVDSVNGKTGAVTITIPTALKSPSAMTVTLNGGTTEGTNKFTYDGSAAKTVNITPAGIGAQPAGSYLTAADIANKVDKVTGKGLSTNDYTTAEKNLVATISNKLNASDIVAITDAEITALFA